MLFLFFSILGEWGGWVLESMENSILFFECFSYSATFFMLINAVLVSVSHVWTHHHEMRLMKSPFQDLWLCSFKQFWVPIGWCWPLLCSLPSSWNRQIVQPLTRFITQSSVKHVLKDKIKRIQDKIRDIGKIWVQQHHV